MTIPNHFPYITAINATNPYLHRQFRIEIHDYKPFSHLILTGKNGSGKTTILRGIDRLYSEEDATPQFEISSISEDFTNKVVHVNKLKSHNSNIIRDISLEHSVSYRNGNINDGSILLPHEYSDYLDYSTIYFYYKAVRDIKPDAVEGPVKEREFSKKLNDPTSTDFFIKKFKQYLVNKKIDQAFNLISKNFSEAEQVDSFFEILKQRLSTILDLTLKSIDFDHSNYEFYINTSDDKRLTLDRLSEGFSAISSIMISLLVKVDIIRKNHKSYKYDPCGIVLIDEPETHLHLELQEQIMPILTDLFPNIQFIVATHSPAVIASIKNATIFDLTTQETRTSEITVGRSYSELTTTHFGLKNDYSAIADEYLQQIDNIIDTYSDNPAELKQKLIDWQQANQQFLSPTLQVKLEYIIAQQDAKLAVAR